MHFIKDNIHGSIPLTNLERIVLNMPEVYRLHFISQMGFTKFAYPSASHTRFSHSIGVMHIAGEIYRYSLINNKDIAKKFLMDFYDNFLKNHLNNSDKYVEIIRTLLGQHICDMFHINFKQEQNTQNTSETLISYFVGLQAVRLAGLLHDIGHLPFSHSSEQIVLKNIENEISKKQKTHQYIRKKPHEYIRDLIIKEIGNRISSTKTGEEKIIVDLIFDTVKKIFTEKKGVFLFFSNIIDGDLDADRIDYIVRDGLFTGLFGTGNSIDINRIIMTFSIYKHNQDGKYELLPGLQSLNDIELLLYKRNKIYDFAVNHHRTRLYNGLIETLLVEKSLVSEDSEYESFRSLKNLTNILEDSINGELSDEKVSKLIELLIKLNDSVILNDLLLLANSNLKPKEAIIARYLFHHKGRFRTLWKNVAHWRNLYKELSDEDKEKLKNLKQVMPTLPESYKIEWEGIILFITTIYNYTRVSELRLRDIKSGEVLSNFKIGEELKSSDSILFYAYTNIDISDCKYKKNITRNVFKYSLSLLSKGTSSKNLLESKIIENLKRCRKKRR